MLSFLSKLPAIGEFFPPTHNAYRTLMNVYSLFPVFTVFQWLFPAHQAMGKTSISSRLNLPGRWAWCIAEAVGPINLIYILYSLPSRLPPLFSSTTLMLANNSLFGTGLPLAHEIMGLLYVLHYLNRAIITPLFVTPSMSPIHASVSLSMAMFQFMNSSAIAGWLCYDAQNRLVDSSRHGNPPMLTLFSVVGISLFILGTGGNISAEWHLMDLRRGAAKRKARSEGKAIVTYDKVYVVPEAKGLFKYVLYPHYSLEWVEWTGYWILGAAWGLGWTWPESAALVFVLNELASMTPRAVDGVRWYDKKFGKKAVAKRKAVIPGLL